MESSYARELSEVTSRRNRLRDELLAPADSSLQAELGAAGTAEQLVLTLRNASTQVAGSVSVQARWVGFPAGTNVEWMEPIRPGYAASLPLSPPQAPALAGREEDVRLSLAVLVRWERGGRSGQRYLRATFVLSP